MATSKRRSRCPLNLAVEVLGDKWTLVVLRDIIFTDRRYFRELLHNSEEGIASNVLADRLKNLLEHGLLSAAADPRHKQKVRYSLTPAAVELLPSIIQLGAWGADHADADPLAGMWFTVLRAQGPDVWNLLMGELRDRHLDEVPASQRAEPTFDQMMVLYREERGRRHVAPLIG